MIGTDDPPGITALSLRPGRIPPARSWMRSFMGKPMVISKLPGLVTWPHTENNLVPVLLGLERQSPLYQAAPRLMIGPTAARVSTLLMVVGIPNKPAWAGKGGLIR